MTITWSHQDVEFLGPRILTSSDQTWSWIRSTLHHVSVTTFGRIEYFSQATARPLFWCPVGINHMYDRGRLKQRRNMIIVPSPEGLICVCYSSGCSGCSRLWQLTKAELKKKKKKWKRRRREARLSNCSCGSTHVWSDSNSPRPAAEVDVDEAPLANLLGPFPGKLCGITGGSSLTEWWDFRPRSAGREVLAAAGPGCGCADAEAVQPWCFYNPMNSRGRTHVSYRFIYQLIISIKLCPH